MKLDYEFIIIVVIFLIPGFITNTITSKYMFQNSEDKQLTIVRYIFYTSINFVISIIVGLIINGVFQPSLIILELIIIPIVIINSYLIGLIIIFLIKYELLEKIFVILGLGSIHSIPTSWDYKFSNISDKRWLIVTLKDDTKCYGFYGKNSFCSSSFDERDIYLEKVYELIGEDWNLVERTDGILIKGNEIKYIEFKI